MKLFVPAVGYRIKLTQEWCFDLHHESRNDTLLEKILGEEAFEKLTYNWRNPGSTPAKLDAGTILEVDRVYVRTANKARSGEDDYDSVTFKVIDDTKKKCRFWAKLADVNNIEYELPPDHTAGKIAAQERAKKPKKLDPARVCEIVRNAMSTVVHGKRSCYGPIPTWMTLSAVEKLKSVAEEYARIRKPYEEARFEAEKDRKRKELELAIATGQLHLPIGVADKIKSVDDLKRFGMYETYGGRDRFEPRFHSWDYVISYVVMHDYNGGTRKFERVSDNMCCRTFAPSPINREYGYEKDAPDMTHLWVKVFTDKDDLQIVGLDAGFNERKV